LAQNHLVAAERAVFRRLRYLALLERTLAAMADSKPIDRWTQFLVREREFNQEMIRYYRGILTPTETPALPLEIGGGAEVLLTAPSSAIPLLGGLEDPFITTFLGVQAPLERVGVDPLERAEISQRPGLLGRFPGK
ncbi:MAG: hypothetical protein Q7S00_07915, partial [bacterium]|nr:hypothetical protein [bacterium]